MALWACVESTALRTGARFLSSMKNSVSLSLPVSLSLFFSMPATGELRESSREFLYACYRVQESSRALTLAYPLWASLSAFFVLVIHTALARLDQLTGHTSRIQTYDAPGHI